MFEPVRTQHCSRTAAASNVSKRCMSYLQGGCTHRPQYIFSIQEQVRLAIHPCSCDRQGKIHCHVYANVLPTSRVFPLFVEFLGMTLLSHTRYGDVVGNGKKIAGTVFSHGNIPLPSLPIPSKAPSIFSQLSHGVLCIRF